MGSSPRTGSAVGTPRLSLCLIARDEEDLLPGCLASVVGVVDEVVVLDTGSTDATPDVARAAGARVVHSAWADDFAAARNAAAAAATGSWVLVLDADERLVDGGPLRAALDRDDLDCGFLPLHNAATLDEGTDHVVASRPAVLLPRLFRRTPDLRWEGIVHEQVTGWLAPRRDRVAVIPAPIVHYGNVPEYREARGKNSRNRRLLELQAASGPADPSQLAHLACMRASDGDLVGAWQLVDCAWSLLDTEMGRPGWHRSPVQLATVRTKLQLDRGDRAGAQRTLDTVARWADCWPELQVADVHPNLQYHRGVLAELRAGCLPHGTARFVELRRAETYYEWAIEGGDLPLTCEVDDGVCGWMARLRRGSALRQLGRYEEALACFARVAAEGHDLQEAAEGRDEATRALALLRGEAIAPDSDPGGEDFVFVGGAGRSGTTLLRAMLHAHPRLHAGPEAKLVPIICGLREQWLETMGPGLAEAGVTAAVLDASVRAFITTLVSSLGPAGLRIVEKTPHDVLCTGLLARLFPRARFIHLLRDGRAVAASLVRQTWVDPATGAPAPMCQDLESAARYWAEVVHRARFEATRAPGRVLEVRYEELVTDPERTMRLVLAFLGEPWAGAVLRHHEAEVVLPARESSSGDAGRPVDPGRAEHWRNALSVDDQRVVTEALGSTGRWPSVGGAGHPAECVTSLGADARDRADTGSRERMPPDSRPGANEGSSTLQPQVEGT